jgi:hypothetical protein
VRESGTGGVRVARSRQIERRHFDTLRVETGRAHLQRTNEETSHDDEEETQCHLRNDEGMAHP